MAVDITRDARNVFFCSDNRIDRIKFIYCRFFRETINKLLITILVRVIVINFIRTTTRLREVKLLYIIEI